MDRATIIQESLSNYWNVRDEYKTLNINELKDICLKDARPFAVCAINVTGDLNLGVMIRTACLMGAERFIVYGKKGYDRRSTVGAQNYIDVVKAGSIDRYGNHDIDYSEFFPTMNRYGYEPVFCETGGESIYEFDFTPTGLKPCLVFGNEGMGIDPQLMVGQKIVSIPQRGVLRSLNVCAAASIAIAHFAQRV
jgi:tRNA G18 (ribose-2'-O)-methylase SpoU